MPSPSWIEVNLPAIASNVREVRRVLSGRIAGSTASPRQAGPPSAAICAVLKADAYGMGAPRVAKRMQIAGVEMFAVYTPEQARALVESAITSPILVLMPLHDLDRADVLYRAAARGQLHLTIHDEATLTAAATITERLGLRLSVQLELDTGMSRGGVTPAEAGVLLSRIAAHPRLSLAGVFNHLSSAQGDAEVTRAQADAFTRWLDEHRRLIPAETLVHEANTFGLFRSAGHHRTMARVGLALLGYAREEFGDGAEFEFEAEAGRLSPAFRWVSRLVHVKRLAPGTPVGYGATWRASRPTRLGLVPVGYADGYPLALSNNGHVGLSLAEGIKAYAPVVGRVNMDQLTIDLTDVPESHAGVGAEVEIVGSDRSAPNHLPTLARRAGTISHELLCRLSPRLSRQYISVEAGGSPAVPVTGAVAV